MKANEKKQKNGTGKKDASTLHPEMKMEDIVHEMIQYVLDNEVYLYPYISWISKGQLLWGAGRHWKEAPCHLQKGILKHLGIKKPSQMDLDFQKRRFGYCMEWPEPKTWALTSIMKSAFINKKASGIQYDDLEFLYGRGYINEKTGKIDTEYSSGISGWFVMHGDSEYRQEQIEWLASQPVYVRAQYERCCDTFANVVQQQIESGNRKALTNSRLLDQDAYKEIRSSLKDRQLLPEEAA